MHGFRGPRVARLSLGLALAAVLIVAGCAGIPGGAGGAGSGGGGGAGGGGGGGALTGRTFLSESVSEHGRPRPLVDGTRIRLSFTETGYVTASAGCNLLSGPVRVERGRLVVGDLSSTDMACSAELGAQDEWLAGVLAADPAYVLHGPRLRLTVGDTVIGLVDREVAEPDVPLESAIWHLEGIADGDAVSSVPAGAGATLTFDDGQVLIRVDHCNQGGGDVVIGESTLTVGPLRMTRMACQQGPAEVEAAVTEVLAGTVAYSIDADVLTLTHPGGQGLVLRAEQRR